MSQPPSIFETDGIRSVPMTAPPSLYGKRTSAGSSQARQRRLKSARLVGKYEKPWIEASPYKNRERWDKLILWGCILIGFGIGIALCVLKYLQIPRNQYCLVMDDEFENLDNWSHEVEIGGFGSNSFEWTTDDPLNSYVADDGLHIKPTLTLDTTNITLDELLNGYTLNLTADGTCTSNDTTSTDCVRTSNATTTTIINPVRSARITTQGKKTIRYGRVEVVAKIPAGQWLWPAIWMMPENSVYGVWPRSGEIDLMEARGNDPTTYPLGANTIYSTIHWGLDYFTDQSKKTASWYTRQRGAYSSGFHTYGLEWTPKYLFIYIDNKLLQSLTVKFGPKTMWERSGLEAAGNSSKDPWSYQGSSVSTPFDQDFYLILNVAVGTTNGFFADSVGGKPWVDRGSPAAMMDFWKANATWYPTWDPEGMIVKSAKMWQLGSCSSPEL
ncbi:glycoside hydrolase family 16 protein [Hyaloscypha variabilis F]|uniref:Glycoside hydrolase family 16 protein n=1 Tax=Hyaloscypha variabilis (strain UAMH 11265 / GT02V1 / F) TaxID=1149755 RepID=A0A2J6R6H0_HYAVF|nr:glycoside hydrolase family 16 protein [Hyaloscypha variabilis F]